MQAKPSFFVASLFLLQTISDLRVLASADAEVASARFVPVGHSQDCRHFAVQGFFEHAGCL
jgi:hypothetical protein